MNLPLSLLSSLAAVDYPAAVSLEPATIGDRLKAGVCQYPTHPYPTPYPASLTAVGLRSADRRQHSAGQTPGGLYVRARSCQRASGRLSADACGVSERNGYQRGNGKDWLNRRFVFWNSTISLIPEAGVTCARDASDQGSRYDAAAQIAGGTGDPEGTKGTRLIERSRRRGRN